MDDVRAIIKRVEKVNGRSSESGWLVLVERSIVCVTLMSTLSLGAEAPSGVSGCHVLVLMSQAGHYFVMYGRIRP